jgi:trans-aconitate 2-methyltransferase
MMKPIVSTLTCLATASRVRIPSSFGMSQRANASTSAKDWSAAQYLKFEKDRTRPARDLLAQISLAAPRSIVDLGCGPGNSTALLQGRYPSATLIGMDSSPDMLEKARANIPDVTFEEGDMANYKPPNESVDLFYSNAAFQWLQPEPRIKAYKHLIDLLPSEGVLAVQIPDNLDEPTHTLMRSLAERDPWVKVLGPLKSTLIRKIQKPQEIYNELKPLCSDVDLWHTTYYHVLNDHDAVVEWVKGTGLRPFIDPLDEDMRKSFLEEYLKGIKKQYSSSVDGKVILRYPRLFMVATKA